jgi:hypothetical protein
MNIMNENESKQNTCVYFCLVRGKIAPRQCLPIKVTFMAIEAPAFHDIDLVCEVYNETILEQYALDLKRWECNIQEKWERFEINDDEYAACLRTGTIDDTDQQQHSNQFQQGSTLQMCQTLPPVLVNYELDESNVDRTRRLRAHAKQQLKIRPQIPNPELLHLAFTARTLVYNEYLDLCLDTSQLGRFFIDTCLGKTCIAIVFRSCSILDYLFRCCTIVLNHKRTNSTRRLQVH